MSVRANPKSIGLFIIGAAILTVVGIAVLASTAWFDKPSTFVSYFGESVNGLAVGAPVKFQGVAVGTVTELLIRIDRVDKTFQVPVKYDVDLTRLTTRRGTYVDLEDPAVMKQQIRDGLRAQLQMESVVTGQLYIELSYNPDAAPPELTGGTAKVPEIPTTASLMAALGTEAGSLVADVFKILYRVNEMLEQVDMVGINKSVVASARSVEMLAESTEIRAAFGQVPAMSSQFNQTMAEMQVLASKLGGTIAPLQSGLDSTNAEVVLTLQSMRRAVDETQGLLSTDSGIGYKMGEAFESMKEAADALTLLTLALERNPDMLLRGKKNPEETASRK